MKLSVIVCTRNRAHAITPCLDSIVQSLTRAAAVDAEIVVVDNGSEDNTSDLVRKWASSCDFPVKVQLEPRKGLSVARNCGIRAAQGDLLIWTDDDCRLSADYICDALRHDTADTAPVLRGGRVELGDPTDLPLSIKTDLSVRRWSHVTSLKKNEGLSTSIIGCNMTMRRSVIDTVGFFDERFGAGTSLPGGDETDFIFRAYLANIAIEYVPDMVVFHHHGRKQHGDGNKLMRNYIIGSGALYAKYLFKNIRTDRPAIRDGWFVIKELVSGNNYFRPDLGFYLRDMIASWALGVARYFVVSIRQEGRV